MEESYWHRKDEIGVAGQVSNVPVQGDILLCSSCLAHSQRNSQDSIGTKLGCGQNQGGVRLCRQQPPAQRVPLPAQPWAHHSSDSAPRSSPAASHALYFPGQTKGMNYICSLCRPSQASDCLSSLDPQQRGPTRKKQLLRRGG